MAFVHLALRIARLSAPIALGGLLLMTGVLVTALPASANGDPTVRVRAGDSLSSISLAYYGDASHARAIASYNHLKDPNKIRVGQVLRLPPRGAVTAAPAVKSLPGSMHGVATWYGPGFEGKTTKCGQTYRQVGQSVASNDYPCGTLLEVTNTQNGRKVTVPVTDTGAFRHPNIADLSRGAFARLEAIRIGVIPVQVVLRALPHPHAGVRRELNAAQAKDGHR